MMIVRRSRHRTRLRDANHDTSLSFRPDHANPALRGWGALAQLSESRLAPNATLSLTVAHAAERIRYVREGSLMYEYAAGGAALLHAGEFQHATCAADVRQRERNPARDATAQIFSLWFERGAAELDPPLAQKRFSTAERRGRLCIIAAQDGRAGALLLQQDVAVYSALLERGQHLVHALARRRSAWLHVVQGRVQVGALSLRTGDAVGVTSERSLSFTAGPALEILLIDVAGC
jgi:redox-sensitive bicupin YhaK (pirin superfamily)